MNNGTACPEKRCKIMQNLKPVPCGGTGLKL